MKMDISGPSPIRHVRITDELWKAAKDKAHEEHTNVGAAVRAFLIAWTGYPDEGTKTREPDEAINATAREIIRNLPSMP